MPLDFNSYRAFQLPVKPPDSPLQIAQDVATLKDTQALSQERQALLQDRQQKLQQEAQDRQEQGQMQAVLAANQGDMEKSYPQLAAINAEKADKYLQAHLQNAELTNKLGEIDTQKQSTVAKYVTDQLTPVQNQHDYDVARAQIQSARALMKLPPASEQDMPAVYDPVRVAQMVKNGQMTQDVLGKQQKGSVAFYTLPGDPTPHAMKVTPDGQVIWQGQDVREQAQPWDKSADKPDKFNAQQLRLEAYARKKGYVDPQGNPDLSKLTDADWTSLKREDKQAITVNAGGGAASNAVSDVKESVAGMKDGTVPPQLPGRASKEYTAVMAEAHRQGFNLVKANEDWVATQKYLATLNGQQQTRLRQAVEQVQESVPLVRSLVSQWDSAGIPVLSSANLKAAKAGAYGNKAQSLANRLDAQIADMTSELGTVYKGGNSSTDESLKLADKNLHSDWSKQAALDALTQIEQNIQFRKNSMKLGPVTNEGNQYAPNLGGPQPTSTGPKVGERRNFNGKIGEWDGKGWKAVQ